MTATAFVVARPPAVVEYAGESHGPCLSLQLTSPRVKMLGLLSEHDGFHKLIENTDFESNMESASYESSLEQTRSYRERIRSVVQSRGTLFLISVLLIIDSIDVSIYLLLEMEVLYIGKGYGFFFGVMHVVSLGILAVFVVEITLRMIAEGPAFFHSLFNIIDTVVVFVSVVFDVAFTVYGSSRFLSGIQVVIIFRFWRITRILNGIVASVRTKAKYAIQLERFASSVYYSELEHYKQVCALQTEIISRLKTTLNELEGNKRRGDLQSEEISRLETILNANKIAFLSKNPDAPV
ncbi:hypothetical protein BsWGS_07461 [Bradybaena similaris]